MAIVNLTVQIRRKDHGLEDFKKLIRSEYNAVYVGVMANETTNDPTIRQLNNLVKKDKLVMIATVQEFGAIIKHPGGTDWGFASKIAEVLNQIRFLRGGKGYLVLGQTPPHTIVIPPRPFIRSTFSNKSAKITAHAKSLFPDIINRNITKFQALVKIGVFIQTEIKRTIQSNIPPPNALSTIRKKKSSHTLIDKKMLTNSITWDVRKQ